MYCHGGQDPATKGPRVGCAVMWRYWRVVDEYAEVYYLSGDGMPPPKWWKRRQWRDYARVKRTLEALRLEASKKESGNGQ